MAAGAPSSIGDVDADGIPDLMVKFDRKALVSYLKSQSTSGPLTLSVTGTVKGESFVCNDDIRVIPK